MRGGRFVCVAVPLILALIALILALVVTLAGVATHGLYLFTIDLSDAKVSTANIQNLLNSIDPGLGNDVESAIKNGNVDLGDLKIPQSVGFDLGTIFGNGKTKRDNDDDVIIAARDDSVSLVSLGFSNKYEVNLWGYCSINKDNKKNCTKSKFDWAHDDVDVDKLEDIYKSFTGGQVFEKSTADAIKLFQKVIKYAEIAFIVTCAVLGVEFLFGIFATCSRIVSCLVWVIGSIGATIFGVSAGLATATAVIAVGAINGTDKVLHIKGKTDATYLAVMWIGVAFAISAGLVWIFTICCCSPESRNKGGVGAGRFYKDSRGFGIEEDEKPLTFNPGFNARRGYAPLDDPQQSHINDHQPHEDDYANPAYRSDLAYEPYSHRA